MSAGSAKGRIRVGTQGWLYDDWAGTFYPEGTSQPDTLRLYARAFDTVEVDSTFYAVPSVSAVAGWAERTPPEFTLSLKLPREITHDRRLLDCGALLQEFVHRVRRLGRRLGPILVQMGPDFTPASAAALEAFLPLLARDLRFAVELRHSGWISRETHELLAMHGVALALSDGPWISRSWLLQLVDRPTAGFHYIRWMGPDRSLTDFSRVQVDRAEELDVWTDAIRPLEDRGLDCYAYFSNFFEGHAPGSARSFQTRLGREPVDPGSLGDQISLF